MKKTKDIHQKNNIGPLKNRAQENDIFQFDDEINEMTSGRKVGHKILWTFMFFVVVGIIWACVAKIDEATIAEGKVIPSSKVQKVQNLEGGIIKQILVREGQHVNKGQVLMYLDETKFASDIGEFKKKHLSLRATIARLNAEINNTPLHYPDDLTKKIPDLIKTQTALYNSRQNELKTLKERRTLLSREIEMTKPLTAEGVTSEVELMRLQQDLGELDGTILKFKSTALDELNDAKEELTRMNETRVAYRDRLERRAVRSPVKGIVKQIHVSTVGGVIQPGMDLIDILPIEDTLLVEARVRPRNIGFLHPGQTAMVKISAYDYAIYGGLSAKLEHIGVDTIKEDDGNSYYEIWVRTNKAYLGTKQHPLQIIPGMIATVDILTGKKTVMTYLLKPLIRAKERALRER